MDHLHHAFRSPETQDFQALDNAVRAATSRSDALSWEQLSATATLVTTRDGSPLRTIITGRRRIPTGTYASRKAGRSLPYESMNERAFFMHSEVDTNVVDYAHSFLAHQPRGGTGTFAALHRLAKATSDIPIEAARVLIG